jgi:hypothetical protein
MRRIVSSISVFRPYGDIGIASQPGHVRVERAPVVRVPGGERRHPDRLGVTHLIEQPVQVRVLDRPQRNY